MSYMGANRLFLPVHFVVVSGVTIHWGKTVWTEKITSANVVTFLAAVRGKKVFSFVSGGVFSLLTFWAGLEPAERLRPKISTRTVFI